MTDTICHSVHFTIYTGIPKCLVEIVHSSSSSEWSNLLALIELLLSLPASNGKLERAFSQMNVIKTNKRSLMSNNSLDDCLLLTVDGVPLSSFNPDAAIDLWWSDKQRRPSQQKRKLYKRHSKPKATNKSSDFEEDESDHNSSDTDPGILSDWDSWMTS